MKKSLPVLLFALLACAGAGVSADPGQARVIISCSANGENCVKKPVPSTQPAKPSLPPDIPGDAQMGMMAAPMMMAPPSLASASMPPAPSTPPVLPASVETPAIATIPDSAHAACAKRKPGRKVTVKLGPNESMSGICEKVDGAMQFRMRKHRHAG